MTSDEKHELDEALQREVIALESDFSVRATAV